MSERPSQGTIIQQWVQKAESDFASAKRLFTESESCSYDTVCFHAQQCVEKYIKALLLQHRVNFPKSHDIGELIGLVPEGRQIPLTPEEQSKISFYAIAGRYPIDGIEDLSRHDAELGLKAAEKVRNYIRDCLKIN
jgi:HEPN domain-containing protein